MPESTRRSTRSRNHIDKEIPEPVVPETFSVITGTNVVVSRLLETQATRQHVESRPPAVSIFDWEKELPLGRGARGSLKYDPLTDAAYTKLNAFPETLERRTTKLERDRLHVEKQRLVNTLGEYKAKISAITGRSDVHTGFESSVNALQKKIQRLDYIFAIGEEVAANADSIPHPGPSLSTARSKKRPDPDNKAEHRHQDVDKKPALDVKSRKSTTKSNGPSIVQPQDAPKKPKITKSEPIVHCAQNEPSTDHRLSPETLERKAPSSSDLPNSFFQSSALREKALSSKKPGSRSLYAFGEKIPTNVLEAHENFDLVPEGWMRAYRNGWDSEELGLGKGDEFQSMIKTRLDKGKRA